MGILWDEGYRESTCPRRDNCMYYVEGFYARHISHIDDYDQLHNEAGKPCTYYYPRQQERQRNDNEAIFGV